MCEVSRDHTVYFRRGDHVMVIGFSICTSSSSIDETTTCSPSLSGEKHRRLETFHLPVNLAGDGS